MTTYHVAHDADGRILCVGEGERPTMLGADLEWIEIEAGDPPDCYGSRVRGGKVVKADEAPVYAPATPPPKEAFLNALYQQSIGNNEAMKQYNLAASMYISMKGKK